MTNLRSKKSLKREEKRNSPQSIEFRTRVESFLEDTGANKNLAYHLRQDLSKMTNMEYYGLSKGTRIEILKPRKLVEQYCELLIRQNDHAFSGKLLRKLSVQQNQSIRKLFPKSKAQRDRESMIGKSNGIWEHPIPIRYVCKVLTELVSQGNIKTVSRFLDRICLVNQVFLTSEEDACVNALYRDSMPEGWGWESPYSDVYIRYHSAGLLVENLLSKHSLNEIK